MSYARWPSPGRWSSSRPAHPLRSRSPRSTSSTTGNRARARRGAGARRGRRTRTGRPRYAELRLGRRHVHLADVDPDRDGHLRRVRLVDAEREPVDRGSVHRRSRGRRLQRRRGTSRRAVGQWQLLGTFPFTAGSAGTVRVSDANGEASADAVRFVSATGSFTLTVTKAGSGGGLVSAAPHGINCATDCSEAYASGTNVTLTATPLAGSTFAGWSGHADCSDGSVTMTASKTCTATFNGTPVAEIVVNNAGSGTTLTGGWCQSTAPRPYGRRPWRAATAGPTHTDGHRRFPTTGSYDVYAWWTSTATRSSAGAVHGGARWGDVQHDEEPAEQAAASGSPWARSRSTRGRAGTSRSRTRTGRRRRMPCGGWPVAEARAPRSWRSRR